MEGFISKKPIIFWLILLSIVSVGFLIFISVYSFDSSIKAPPAINYAPNLWFDSQEQYYPTNILDFYFEDGIEVLGEIAVEKYNKLSFDQKLDQMTVFYHIEDEGGQWVYQYWFFYAFNGSLGLIKNRHYGDWEAVYVFVDKDSEKVIKVIGTAHQRKIFDTEIYTPETNHIWSYIGGGSHANCIDEKDDGYCDRKRWRLVEKWDKNGPKISYNNYNLKEITFDFIKIFEGITTLERSSELGINLFNYLKVNKEFYISWGGNPPIHAWEQSNYYNPEEIRPIGWRYISEKIEKVKDKTFAFVSGLVIEVSVFFKKEEQVQGASISSIVLENPDILNSPEQISPTILPLPESINKEEIVVAEEISIEEVIVSEEIIVFEEIQAETLTEVVIKEVKEFVLAQSLPLTPPFGMPFFLGGGGASPAEESIEPEIEAEPEPDTTPPDAISDLLASSGDSRGTINLSWTAPEADQYIIKYATSSEITSLNWASSTDIIGELTPSLASTTESFSVSGLDINQIYYWAIKSQDEAGNISGLSNIASTTASALADYVIINEVQLGSNEFVELYNPTDQVIDMTGWYWSYFSSNNDWNNPYRNQEFPNGASIPAQGYYLIGLSGYLENNDYVDADWQVYSSNQLNGISGSAAIFPWDPTEKTIEEAQNGAIDVLGWGSVDNVYETAVPLASVSDKSLIRQINGWDTDNNSNDFIESNWPTPQNSQGDKAAIIADSFSFTQDTIFTLNNSPYILESNSGVYPTVVDGVTLSIEAGVTIKAYNKYYPSLVIKGALKAEGTSINPIVFTATTSTPQTGDWSGIVFDNANDGSVLEYVNFKYGGYQISYGATQIQEMIRIDNTQVTISNSIFEYSQNNGIYLDNSNSFISDSSFKNNTSTGIIINDSGSSSINNCEFENNNIGIEIINQASPIINNNIFSNNNYPIEIKSSYPVLSSNQAIDNNLNGVVINQDSVFTQDVTWNNDLPYILFSGNNNYPTVASGTVLTLESGVVIKPYAEYYTALLIEGSLIAQGATSTPIIFTSLKDDNYGGDANNDNSDTDPENGDWKNIKFVAGSNGELEHILFRYGSSSVLDIDNEANVNQNNIVYEP